MTREPWAPDEPFEDSDEVELDVEIRLCEVEGDNPPNAIRSALSAARDSLPGLVESARLWAHGKALQEVGKSAELRHRLVQEAARIEMERERMVAERDARREEGETKREVAHAEAIKARAEAVKAVAEAAKTLREAGLTGAQVLALIGPYAALLAPTELTAVQAGEIGESL
jgi:hypothetical protein